MTVILAIKNLNPIQYTLFRFPFIYYFQFHKKNVIEMNVILRKAKMQVFLVHF